MLLKVQGNPYFIQMYENEMNITNIMITFWKKSNLSHLSTWISTWTEFGTVFGRNHKWHFHSAAKRGTWLPKFHAKVKKCHFGNFSKKDLDGCALLVPALKKF